jgi:hypothetical protein
MSTKLERVIHVLNLHLRRRCVALARGAAADGDSRGVGGRAGGVGDKIEEGDFGRGAVLEDGVDGVVDVGGEVDDLRRVLRAHHLRHHERRIVHGADGPRAKGRLVHRRRRERLVVRVLPR